MTADQQKAQRSSELSPNERLRDDVQALRARVESLERIVDHRGDRGNAIPDDLGKWPAPFMLLLRFATSQIIAVPFMALLNFLQPQTPGWVLVTAFVLFGLVAFAASFKSMRRWLSGRTFTGADDATDMDGMVDLSRHYSSNGGPQS